MTATEAQSTGQCGGGKDTMDSYAGEGPFSFETDLCFVFYRVRSFFK